MKFVSLCSLLVLVAQTGCIGGYKTSQAALSSKVGTLAAKTSASAAVHILDANGIPVSGATVLGSWSGVVSGSSSAVTNADGYATLISPLAGTSGTYSLTVTSVAKASYTYDPNQNRLTANSITK